jgi:hypothetical protein
MPLSTISDWDEMGFMESLLTWRRFVGDRMVIVYVISVYHHWCCKFESRSGRGVQHDVIKVFSTNKADRHDITEISTNAELINGLEMILPILELFTI